MSSTVSFDDHVHRADDHRSSGRSLEAATDYGLALETDPGLQHVWVQYAHMLKDSGLLEEAAFAYRRAIARDATNPDPWLHLAHLLKRMNRPADAIDAFHSLAALPDAPVVEHEIAGLSVAMLNDGVARHEDNARPVGEAVDTCIAGWQRLNASEAAHAAAPLPAAAAGKPRLRDAFARAQILPSHLQPMKNLVIRDGAYIATTDDPQFSVERDVLDDDGVIVGSAVIDAGWYEMTVHLADTALPPHPVLYVEKKAPWARFTTHRFAAIGRDLFRAFVLIEAPFGRLRLDPSSVEGRFTGGDFTLRKLSLGGVLRHAFQIDSTAVLRAATDLARHRSIASFEQAVVDLLAEPHPDRYQLWIERHEPDSSRTDPLRIAETVVQPSIRILLDARDAGVGEAAAAIRSVRRQVYDNWALDIIGPATREAVLEERVIEDQRIRVLPTTDLSGDPIDGEPAQGPAFYLTMGVRHRLAASALADLAAHVRAHPTERLIYGDSDNVRADGRRHSPLFRPDWNEDFCLTGHYIGDVALIAAPAFRTVATAMQATPVFADLYPFLLQMTETLAPDAIGHMPQVLYHTADGTPLSGTTGAVDARRGALQASLDRRGWTATVTPGLNGYQRIVWVLPSPSPAVTLIIPTRDRADLLEACIASLLAHTAYPDFDILIVDNDSVEPATLDLFDRLKADSRIRVLPVSGPFNFSRLNNLAVAEARGSVVGLVNNDIVAIHANWLEEMVSQALRPSVGAVGAKLVYESGHIQHAGIVCGIGAITGHGHKYADGDAAGYMGRLACLQTVSAVTAACLVVEKAKYLAVGGLDEEHLPVSFNDVDLCLKLDAKGFKTIFTPHARLYHRESVSRGLDTSPEKAARYATEGNVMLERWGDRLRTDPFYNINLTREREDFSL